MSMTRLGVKGGDKAQLKLQSQVVVVVVFNVFCVCRKSLLSYFPEHQPWRGDLAFSPYPSAIPASFCFLQKLKIYTGEIMLRLFF